jgi:hypothetical protein
MKKSLYFLFLLLSYNLYSQSYTELTNTGLENKGLGSIATGDLNNDGYLDIITTGIDESFELSTSVYINNKDGSFTKLDVNLTPMYNATICLGDYNGDGFLDILLSGEGYDPIASLWKNNGDLTFTEVNSGLPNLGGTNAEFRDIDNDGDLDILLSGTIRNHDGSYSSDLRLYSNQGNDFFVEFDLSFTSFAVVGTLGDFDNDGDLDLLVSGGSLEVYPNNGDGTFSSPLSFGSFMAAGEMRWFDFNNDGNLDFIISGRGYSADEYFTKVYENVGADNNWFSELPSTDLPNPIRRKLDIRDYNSDGYLDLLITGTLDFSSNSFVTKIYDNSGTAFSENMNVNLRQLGSGDGSWFDIDNDGDLDLILIGEEVQGANIKRTTIYQNDSNDNIYTANSKPVAPTDISWTWANDQVNFSWGKGSDDKTPTAELSYNIGIGTNEEAHDILFPESAINGNRLIQRLGNAHNNNRKAITKLNNGIYYFKVQTIDGMLTGSEFSEVEKFAIGTPLPPSEVTTSFNSNNDLIITWTDNSVNEYFFIIEQRSNLNTDYVEIGYVETNETSFIVPSLEDAIYTFRIKAINPNGESDYVEANDIAIGIPSAPSNFSAILNDRDVILSWDDLVNERNYKLERSTDNGESYEELAILGINTIEYLDEKLAPGMYNYRIQAINENGESGFTNSNLTLEVVVAVSKFSKQTFNIYPNPVINNCFYLEIPDNFSISEIIFRDIRGKLLTPSLTYANDFWKVDTTSLLPGVYIVEFQRQGKRVVSKVIVK